MKQENLKQWMADARLNGKEDADGFLNVSRNNLEISVAYLQDEELVVCFAPILELSTLDDTQRLEVLSQALSLNGVGNLPPGCALSYEDEAEVVYLLWQQSPEQLDSPRFANAFDNFEKAAAQVQEHLNQSLPEETAASNFAEQKFAIKV